MINFEIYEDIFVSPKNSQELTFISYPLSNFTFLDSGITNSSNEKLV